MELISLSPAADPVGTSPLLPACCSKRPSREMSAATTSGHRPPPDLETFAGRLAQMPNEVLSLIFENLQTVEFISILKKVGFELFIKHIPLKRKLERLDPIEIVSMLTHIGEIEQFIKYMSSGTLKKLYSLRASNCTNLVWDEYNFESSLFIIWGLCIHNTENSKEVRPGCAEPASSIIAATKEDDKETTSVKLQQTLSWNFCNNYNLMKVGDVSRRSPIVTIHDFLYAKRNWFHFQIFIWDNNNNNNNRCPWDSLNVKTWVGNYIGLSKFLSPYCTFRQRIITTEIVSILNDLIKSGKFQLVPSIAIGNNFKIFQPIIKMNFDFESVSNIYEQIFGSLSERCYSCTFPSKWFIKTLAHAEQLYFEIESLKNITWCEFVKSEKYISFREISITLHRMENCRNLFEENDKFLTVKFNYGKGLFLVLFKYIEKLYHTIQNYDFTTKSTCFCAQNPPSNRYCSIKMSRNVKIYNPSKI